MADVPQPFDRARRRALRARSAGQDSFFLRWMAEDLGDRLSAVSRGFTDILLIGPIARYRTLLSLAAEATITVAALSEREAEPGDIIIHDVMTIHGAHGNVSDTDMRRAMSFRYCGDDIRYYYRPGAIPQPYITTPLADGAPLYSADYPLVWPKPRPDMKLAPFFNNMPRVA